MMNFNEFLLSNEIGYQFKENYIIKIKFNDTIEFIYKPNYGEFEYGNNLEFLGLFDKEHKALYGSSYYFTHKSDLNSDYYKGSIGDIEKQLFKDATKNLNKYIEKNKEDLMKLARHIFDEFISDENNVSAIKNKAINDYIYQKETKTEFSISFYKYEKEMKQVIIAYLKNPEKITNNIFNEYINNKEQSERYYSYGWSDSNIELTKKEYIGVTLLGEEFKNNFLQELKNNPNNEFKKKHDIINAIKDLDAQMITLELKHDNETLSIKYPRSELYDFNFSSWRIPDLKTRQLVEKTYSDVKGYDDFLLEDIVSIQYNRKILYEDKMLLDKDIEQKKEDNIPDIVDEMFD